MLTIFLKTIWRQIIRSKTYTFINVLGLAIGISCALVIYKIITYEKSFDTYHANFTNIYRLINQYNDPVNGLVYEEGQVHPLGEAIRNDFPGVDAVMTFYAGSGQISIENTTGFPDIYQENTGLVYAEPGIFRIFDFQFIAGDPMRALKDDKSVVITSSLAQKYFKLNQHNITSAIGKTININNKTAFQITGIINDPPDNTDLPFSIIADYKNQTTSNPYFRDGTDWKEYNSATNCYLLLPDKISAEELETRLVPFFNKYCGVDPVYKQKYVLQPLSGLHSGICDNYNHHQVSGKKLMVLGTIGLFLIIIASINFINLSTAMANKRSKEIGVKKISGMSRRQIISQLLGETVIITFIAALVGIVMAHFSFVCFEDIIGYNLRLDILKSSGTVVFLIVLSLIVGLLSGLYPSLIIARAEPVRILKNTSTSKTSSSFFVRNTLVIVQYVISLVLIIGTLTMKKQIDFFMNKDLGFSKDAVLVAKLPNVSGNQLEVLKTNLLKHPEVKLVSYNTRSPLADWKVNNEINYPGLEEDLYFGNLKTIDEDYLKLFDLKLIAGKNCGEKKNTGDAIVNRKLTKLLGFNEPHDALGEVFKYGKRGLEFTIIGVVEDFHAQSLQHEMDNVIFSNLPWNINEMAVKINPAIVDLSGLNNTVKTVGEEWHKIFPNDIFEYNFLDQQIAGLYKGEKQTSNLIQLFAIIAILIGCLGAYGLISYNTMQKIKEIGIRKVNGAKTSEIVWLLNKNVIKWVNTAFIIAMPIAWITMNKWLENFVYKTELSWWIFLLAGVLAMGIALLTVSWQTWRAARRNPVESLRYE